MAIVKKNVIEMRMLREILEAAHMTSGIDAK